MTETETPIGGDLFKSLLLKGILMIILGVIMLVFTFSSILALDYLFGIVLIVLGIQLLTSGSTFLGEYKRTWWVILLGILAIIIGIFAFVFPAVMTLYIVYLIAITSFISGFTDPCTRCSIWCSWYHSWYSVHHLPICRSICYCSGDRNLPARIWYSCNCRGVPGEKSCSNSLTSFLSRTKMLYSPKARVLYEQHRYS